MRSSKTAVFKLDGEILPYLRLGSWVGGDRDGNPNVSPETLDYAVRRQAEIVLDHYLREIHALGAELSLSASLVSTSAVNELALNVGNEVIAFVKATDVALAKLD